MSDIILFLHNHFPAMYDEVWNESVWLYHMDLKSEYKASSQERILPLKLAESMLRVAPRRDSYCPDFDSLLCLPLSEPHFQLAPLVKVFIEEQIRGRSNWDLIAES